MNLELLLFFIISASVFVIGMLLNMRLNIHQQMIKDLVKSIRYLEEDRTSQWIEQLEDRNYDIKKEDLN